MVTMAIHLYLIRHGIAAERGTYANDGDRPLTAEGQKKTKAVAERLAALGLQFDLVLTSPLVRARQTADILIKAQLSSQLQESDDLVPAGDFEAWCRWLSGWAQGDRSSLALVGHEPDLGEWAERLVWGEPRHRLVVKKAGVIGIEMSNLSQPVGTSELFWLSPPRFLL
jgi:phosphohistidine phosphatase